jgi:hypothetical protein
MTGIPKDLIVLGMPFVLLLLAFAYIWRKQFNDREARLRKATLEKILLVTDAMQFGETIPVVAVERFISYIRHPDPTFDPEAIIRQERFNIMAVYNQPNTIPRREG